MIERIRTRVARHANPGSMETIIPSVSIAVAPDDAGPEFMLRGPGVCLVIQGHKKVVIGGEALRQDPGYTFAAVTELPMTRYLIAGNRSAPYLATGLKIDPATLASLFSDLDRMPIRNVVPCFSIAEASGGILEAWDRLLELLDSPDDIRGLAAARERELLYRLLMSEHGPLLRQVVDDDGIFAQIRRVIDLMRVEFDKPKPIKMLADLAGMSVPAFNRRFRACTATSPLQYQKVLQLEAARRMLAKANDVSRTATAVGYSSPSQFSREYKRFFGVQPKRDALLMQSDRHAEG
ncbi:AraC family transcriptional regulator [Phyllobacterium ifriqiyense]|uniref:AraC family transcriptional regulator n=1 Tax=Phyllobacterium ifriqiyense TaxID=314238 RepID=UPI003396A18D